MDHHRDLKRRGSGIIVRRVGHRASAVPGLRNAAAIYGCRCATTQTLGAEKTRAVQGLVVREATAAHTYAAVARTCRGGGGHSRHSTNKAKGQNVLGVHG